MNVKELREFIAGLPDDSIIMVELYPSVGMTVNKAEFMPSDNQVVLHVLKKREKDNG